MPSMYSPKPKVDCENCGQAVTPTRPSKTGRYYCTKKLCRAARQRAYARSRSQAEQVDIDLLIKKATADADQRSRSLFVLLAMSNNPGLRVPCPKCGLVNAVKGLLHPAPDQNPCDGTAEKTLDGLFGGDYSAVWPNLLRDYGTSE